MKKLVLLAAVISVGLASCKKDYTCECKSGSTVVGTSTINSTKGKSTDACNDLSTQYQQAGTSVTCSIK